MTPLRTYPTEQDCLKTECSNHVSNFMNNLFKTIQNNNTDQNQSINCQNINIITDINNETMNNITDFMSALKYNPEKPRYYLEPVNVTVKNDLENFANNSNKKINDTVKNSTLCPMQFSVNHGNKTDVVIYFTNHNDYAESYADYYQRGTYSYDYQESEDSPILQKQVNLTYDLVALNKKYYSKERLIHQISHFFYQDHYSKFIPILEKESIYKNWCQDPIFKSLNDKNNSTQAALWTKYEYMHHDKSWCDQNPQMCDTNSSSCQGMNYYNSDLSFGSFDILVALKRHGHPEIDGLVQSYTQDLTQECVKIIQNNAYNLTCSSVFPTQIIPPKTEPINSGSSNSNNNAGTTTQTTTPPNTNSNSQSTTNTQSSTTQNSGNSIATGTTNTDNSSTDITPDTSSGQNNDIPSQNQTITQNETLPYNQTYFDNNQTNQTINNISVKSNDTINSTNNTQIKTRDAEPEDYNYLQDVLRNFYISAGSLTVKGLIRNFIAHALHDKMPLGKSAQFMNAAIDIVGDGVESLVLVYCSGGSSLLTKVSATVIASIVARLNLLGKTTGILLDLTATISTITSAVIDSLSKGPIAFMGLLGSVAGRMIAPKIVDAITFFSKNCAKNPQKVEELYYRLHQQDHYPDLRVFSACPKITALDDQAASFLSKVRNYVSLRWWANAVPRAQQQVPTTEPQNQPTRTTDPNQIEIQIA